MKILLLAVLASLAQAADPPLLGHLSLDYGREIIDTRPDGLRVPLSDRAHAAREIRYGNLCLIRLERALRVIEAEEDFQKAAALWASRRGGSRVELEVRVRTNGVGRPWKKQSGRAWLESTLVLRLVHASGVVETPGTILLGKSEFVYEDNYRDWTPAASDWWSLIDYGGCAIRWDSLFRELER